MIQYYQYKTSIKRIDVFRRGCWVNVLPPFSQEEFKELHESVGVPMDFLSDTMDIDERTRYEIEGKAKLIVVNTPYANVPNPEVEENEPFYITVPIFIVQIGETVVTIDYFSYLSVNSSVLSNLISMQMISSIQMILHIFEETSKSFMKYLHEINHRINLFEARLYNSNKNEELLNLLKLQKSLVYFVTTLRTNENLFMKLSRMNLLKLDENALDYLSDIVVDTSQALEMSNIYTNILSNTLDSYASIIANNQNEVLRKLSIITLTVTFPTLVASIYGMNVPIPFQGSELAFYLPIALSAVLSLLVGWLMLKRKIF